MDDFIAVRDLMALTFGVPAQEITRDTARAACSQWDSLAHLNLMLALEDIFQVTLTVDDISQLGSVAAILEYLRAARGGEG